MRRRARRIRRAVAGLAAALFAIAFLAIYVQLASGHDPALVANAARRAAAESSTAAESSSGSESSTATESSGGSESSSESSSSAGEESSSGASAVTTSQS
ncbi:MAG: hypothetical protein ABSB69_09265 [Solirubrobacteraceae bacterium]